MHTVHGPLAQMTYVWVSEGRYTHRTHVVDHHGVAEAAQTQELIVGCNDVGGGPVCMQHMHTDTNTGADTRTNMRIHANNCYCGRQNGPVVQLCVCGTWYDMHLEKLSVMFVCCVPR